jgi:hypothetical protein
VNLSEGSPGKVRDACLKQDRLTRHTIDTSKKPAVSSKRKSKKKKKSTRGIEIDLSDFKTHPLWDILTETAERNPMYANLLGYTRDMVIQKNPNITPHELATKLSISLGESLIILDSVKSEESTD